MNATSKSTLLDGTYRRLLRFVRPYTGRIVLGSLCGMLVGGSMGGLLGGMKIVLDQLIPAPTPVAAVETTVSASTEATDTLWHRLKSFMRPVPVTPREGPAPAGGLSAQWRFILIFGLPLFAALRGFGIFAGIYLIEWVGNRTVMDLRNAMFDHLQFLSLGFYNRVKAGDLISRIINDSAMVERTVATVLADLCIQPFVLISVVIAALMTNWRLAVAGLVLFPVCIVPVALFGRRVRRNARQAQQHVAELVSILQESSAGARVVKAFGMEPYEMGRFHARAKDVFGRIMRVTKARAAVDPIVVTMSVAGISLFLLFTQEMEIPLSDLITLGVSMVALYEPFKKLSRIHMQIQQSSAAADRMFELLDTPMEIYDAPDARPFAGEVRAVSFDRVSFAYDGGAPVLDNVNVAVSAGQRVALVGGSGAGKTTLVSLLPRFFDVTGGAVRINGRDVREYTLKSLRALMGLVTQDTFLFNDTVAGNIAYGRRDAGREQIEAAARRAHAHEFIIQMEQGYETVIGDRGVRLSGGQRQRLAIARALLCDPPVLILDEATSALDTESERLVQDAINAVMAGRTVFAIAHRLSTIMHCDQILVLDRGRIVEAGRHDELLALGGVYKRLHDLQFSAQAHI